MNRALLDRESLDRVSWTSTTLAENVLLDLKTQGKSLEEMKRVSSLVNQQTTFY